MLPTKITAALMGVAAVGAAFAMPMAAQADTPAADTEITERARGTVVFRTERYQLSNRAVVSTTPTTIRIVDDSATTLSGTKAGLFIQLGYAHDQPDGAPHQQRRGGPRLRLRHRHLPRGPGDPGR